ncbi:MAG TPA: hypothetical protein VEF05_12525, partial [Terriglobales bacterium]|nr:hypothetical protein [Terriglobales bacterium]
MSCLALIFLSSSGLAQRVFTVAGAYVGDGKPATSASLSWPLYATIDARGNIYISDNIHCRLRRIDTQGKISTVAGTGICGFSGENGPATEAQIYFPEGVVVDGHGNMFFSDFGNSRVREITSMGTILTVAGNGTFGFCGDGGPATQACVSPTAITVAPSPAGEVLYIADTYDNRIRAVVLSTGIINTVAGNGTAGYSGDGGPATQASLNRPQGVAAHGSSFWISDSGNSSIRRVDLNTGIITTLIGDGSCGATLCFTEGISADSAGDLYVASAVGTVFEVEVPSGTVVMKAGSQQVGFSGDGGPALQALFNQPWDAVTDANGNILVVDSLNNRLRKVDTSGNISTIAGGYVGDGGSSIASSLNWAQGLAFDA